MVVLSFDPTSQVYCERCMLACPKGPICSSCCHRGELPGWKLSLGEGHPADSTHLLVTVLQYACHATLCGIDRDYNRASGLNMNAHVTFL
jgi:hypothetical protein